MSIVFERTGSGGGSIWMPPCRRVLVGERRVPVMERSSREDDDDDEEEVDSCSSTSIGRDSDEDYGEEEVQSKGPLDTMDALEEVLPVKRGISKFFHGKSKSFTSLADACSVPSVKDLAKPENPYFRKRKTLIAHANFWDKKHTNHPRDSAILKRLISSNGSTLPIGLSLCRSKNNIYNEESHTLSSSPFSSLPPLHPHGEKSSGYEVWSSPPQWSSP